MIMHAPVLLRPSRPCVKGSYPKILARKMGNISGEHVRQDKTAAACPCERNRTFSRYKLPACGRSRVHIVLSACETAAISTVTHYSTSVPCVREREPLPFAYVITRRSAGRIATSALVYLLYLSGSKSYVSAGLVSFRTAPLRPRYIPSGECQLRVSANW